jgi:conjugal transfer/entry exclusion protein
MQMMSTGVADANTFANLYPGWFDFGPDAADVAAQITNMTLTTYANSIAVAQSQAGDFNAEDAQFTSLEACNATSISVLQAIQCGNEINLAAAQQTQLLRQIEITRLIVEATRAGEELNERSQKGANEQAGLLTAAQQ